MIDSQVGYETRVRREQQALLGYAPRRARTSGGGHL